MIRDLRLPRAAALVLPLLFACSSETVSVGVFKAAPAALTIGGSTTLVFAASPSNATLTIDNGVGDVSGKTEVTVSPTETTTYTITAAHGGKSAKSTAQVTVGAARPSAFSVTLSSPTPTAGQAVTATVTALDAQGATQTWYRGIARLSSDDAAADLPAQVSFPAASAGVATATVTFKKSGAHSLTAFDPAQGGARGLAQATVAPGPATRLDLAGVPASVRAGDNTSTQLTAYDAFNNVATGYAATVTLTSTDAAAALPAPFTFHATDAGTHAFAFSFSSSGSFTVTAKDNAAARLTSSSSPTRVGNGAPTKVALVGLPSEAISGDALTIQVTVQDRFGNTAADYTGTLHFVHSDGGATAIADATFTAADLGTKPVSFSLLTQGLQSVTAQDGALVSLSGSAAIMVKHGAAANYVLSAFPASAVAGTALSLTITAVDNHGNTVKDYPGVAHVSSSDPTDQLPSDGGFDDGVRHVSLVFNRSGAHTATVHEVGGTITVTTNSVNITPGPATTIALVGPASGSAGTPLSFTATALDAHGNTATGYRGTLHLTSNDVAAVLPADIAFTATSPGVRTFSVTLNTAGARTITAVDTVNASIKGTASIALSAGAPAAYILSSLPGTATAGEPLSLTVTVRDAQGNIVTGYPGHAHFTSNDAKAELPADAAFTAGIATVSLAFTRTGSHTVTATEAGGTIQATSNSVVVSASDASRLALTGPASGAAAAALTFTLTAYDRFDNIATGFRGAVALHSDVPGTALPAPTFAAADQGQITFDVTFFIAGARTLFASAPDVNGDTLSTSADLAVSAGGAVSYALSALPATAVAGTPIPLTIMALDGFNNVATSYGGTAHFTSADPTDLLPADTTFASGLAVVAVSFRSAGSHVVSVSEVGGTITATTNSVLITPAAASSVALAGPSSATAGDPISFTVILHDLFGNVATGYAGTLHFTTTDLAAPVIADKTLGASDLGTTSITFTIFTAGPQSLNVADTVLPAVQGSAQIRIDPGTIASYSLSALPIAAIAGDPLPLIVTAKDAQGNTVTNYPGTAHFTSTDPTDELPADTAFTAGVASVAVSFTRSGGHKVTVAQVGGGIASVDTTTVSIAADDATRLGVTSALGTATSGSAFNLTVTALDEFANQVPTYRGTVSFTSTDAQALLPADTTFSAADAGAHSFSVTLKLSGLQRIDAKDLVANISGNSTWVVNAGAAYVITLPVNSMAASAVAAAIQVRDGNGVLVTNYAGTVNFTSSDSRAILPAALVFTGAEGGVASVNVTFGSLGTQTLVGTESANPAVTGLGFTSVHGLVYTDPAAGLGRLRLVFNAAASTASLVQLDLVAATGIGIADIFGVVANGAYAAGMNLPIDTTRVLADATPIIEGLALNTGTTTKAIGAALFTTGPTANIFFTGLSQKSTGAGATTSDRALLAGARLYSIRLKLNPAANAAAAVATLFDGSAGSNAIPGFRAAVRNRIGNDTVSQTDFALGKLEVR